MCRLQAFQQSFHASPLMFDTWKYKGLGIRPLLLQKARRVPRQDLHEVNAVDTGSWGQQ